MKQTTIAQGLRGLAAGLLGVLLAAPASQAADYYLVAREFTKTMPDGRVIPMWGFARDGDNDLATVGAEAAISPGPMLTLPPGDDTLTVHLRNELAVPISLVIPGQPASLAPVRITDSQGRERVTSFTAETAPGATGAYTWTAVRPGTFLYQSGTHPAVQVQMGLYGAVKKDAGVQAAYPATPQIDASYDNEVVLFYSEIDPALHEAVADGTYGTAAYPSTIDYAARYFLINGEPFPEADPLEQMGLQPGQKVLVRFLNGGLETHVPQLVGPYMQIIAEDGNLYPHAKQQYSVLLPAGKTADALLTLDAARPYPIFDRRLALTNHTQPEGGLLAALAVSNCHGDFDYDGDVDLRDLMTLRAEYGHRNCDPQLALCQSDLDGDGDVDLMDLAQFRADYGRRDCLAP